MAVLNRPRTGNNAPRRIRRGTGATSYQLLLVVLMLPLFQIAARAQQFSEYGVKAACVLNFPKYVEWPAPAVPATNSPILITVLAEPKLSAELARLIQAKTGGRPVELKIITRAEEFVPDCQILFIGDMRQWPALRKKLGVAPILTVGESDDFLAQGGVINLVKQAKKISLEVNLAAATQAQLKISSKLLSLARVQKEPAK